LSGSEGTIESETVNIGLLPQARVSPHLAPHQQKMEPHALLLYLLLPLCLAVETLSPIRYSISRRGGSFPAPEVANLTFLLSELRTAESRLNASTRAYHGESDTLIRKPRRLHGSQSESILLGEAGRKGNWFATLEIGEPIQTVDMDLDMLTVDWWILSTRSGTGSFFLDFNSRTYGTVIFV
jgi:hypothetical protein